jgi:hypothetical protein
MGDIFHNKAGDLVRINERGEEEPHTPAPYDPFREHVPDPLDMPRRADGTIAPFYDLTPEQMERAGQLTPSGRAARHDGWTPERQRLFIERLAASASVTDAPAMSASRASPRATFTIAPPRSAPPGTMPCAPPFPCSPKPPSIAPSTAARSRSGIMGRWSAFAKAA